MLASEHCAFSIAWLADKSKGYSCSGELVALVGPSGSGKTTILNLVAGIDRPTAETVTVDGRRIDMSEEGPAIWRGAHVGVVFQFFQLLPTLSARPCDRDVAIGCLWPRSR